MALPKSGLITAAMINVELKRAASAAFSLGGSEERKLAKVLSGPISFADFYGKSSIVTGVNITSPMITLDIPAVTRFYQKGMKDFTKDVPEFFIRDFGYQTQKIKTTYYQGNLIFTLNYAGQQKFLKDFKSGKYSITIGSLTLNIGNTRISTRSNYRIYLRTKTTSTHKAFFDQVNAMRGLLKFRINFGNG